MVAAPSTRRFGTCHGYMEYRYDKSFRTQDDAKKRAAKLRKDGFAVKIENASEEEKDPNMKYRTWFRVPKSKK